MAQVVNKFVRFLAPEGQVSVGTGSCPELFGFRPLFKVLFNIILSSAAKKK